MIAHGNPYLEPCGRFDLRLLERTQLEGHLRSIERPSEGPGRVYVRMSGKLPASLIAWVLEHPGKVLADICVAFPREKRSRICKTLSKLRFTRAIRTEGAPREYRYFVAENPRMVRGPK